MIRGAVGACSTGGTGGNAFNILTHLISVPFGQMSKERIGGIFLGQLGVLGSLRGVDGHMHRYRHHRHRYHSHRGSIGSYRGSGGRGRGYLLRTFTFLMSLPESIALGAEAHFGPKGTTLAAGDGVCLRHGGGFLH